MAIIRRVKNPWARARGALRRSRGTVFVLRHGSTDMDRSGDWEDILTGDMDIGLTAGGEQEVRLTAWMISSEAIGKIWSSDLRRAVRSAEIVSDENVGYPDIEVSSELRSWNLGDSMEGVVKTPDIVSRIRGWAEGDMVVPPGGESFRVFANRLLKYVEPIFTEALEHGDTCAIMAHGRCVQVIDLWASAGCDEVCMHREYSEYLADEPDTVPPGAGIRFKHDGLGWVGSIINTGAASLGTRLAAGVHVRPANEMADKGWGIVL